MALPRKLKNMNLFVDGDSFAGVVKEVELPKLSRKMEAWRGGGMNGEVEADLGMEKLEATMAYGGLVLETLKSFAATTVDALLLRFAGAYQRDDTGEVDAVEIVMRGRYKEIDFGKGKPGDDTEYKTVVPLAYYKLSVNNKVEIEIDLVNFVEVVDGVDRLAEQRRAIGL